MRILISGGGTGGHVYPALAAIRALLEPTATEQPVGIVELLWVGSEGGIEEELVGHAGISYVGLPAGGLRGKGPVDSVRNAIRILASVGRARQILARFAPGVVFVTGGYACVAVTLAAWMRRIPVLIYLPDVVPGKAVKFLSHFAERVAVTSEETRQYFPPSKVVVTGYPVRPELLSVDRAQAHRDLGLDEGERTLLVFGGSSGARSINRALLANLDELLPECQIVHITGKLDAEEVAGAAESLPAASKARYHHYPYLHEMPKALAAADLAIARAGASTIGEFPAVGLPSILVPYPFSGQHQAENAKYLSQNGAACIVWDDQLEEKLAQTASKLLNDDQALSTMRESAMSMAQPNAAESIAVELRLLALQNGTSQVGGKS